MPFSKVSKNHQITIPKDVYDSLRLNPGDIVEITEEKGKAVIVPKRMVTHAPAPKLSEKEQQMLVSAQEKIAAINRDILRAEGLTAEEADVAVRAGLIDPDQKYWWLEEWQKREREAGRDERESRTSGPFESADGLLAHLHKQTV